MKHNSYYNGRIQPDYKTEDNLHKLAIKLNKICDSISQMNNCLNKLEKRVTNMDERLSELIIHVKYMPLGTGYDKSKKHFEKLGKLEEEMDVTNDE